jgi:hypothetical protein
MKTRIALSAALAAATTFSLTTTFSPAMADVVYHPFMVNPSYHVPMTGPLTPFRPRDRHHVARYQPYPFTPVACEAVIFPRSAECAGRPARFSPYSTLPFSAYVYY